MTESLLSLPITSNTENELNDNELHLHVTWNDAKVLIKVSDGEQFWSEKYLLKLKANLDVDSINTDDEYIDATRAAWAGKSDQKQQPTWRTLRCIDGEDLELSWGYLLEDDIKFSLGKVVIPTASTGETKRLRVSWFNSLIQNQLHYSKKCEDLESRIDKLRQSHEELSNSVEIWQEKATEQENVYFTKFTQILNQKKRKIRQYEKALKQHADFTTKLQSEIAELKSQQQKVKSEKMEFESYQPSSPIVKEEDDYNDINNNDVLFQLEKPERVSTPIKNRSPKRIRELEQDEEDSDDEMVPSLLSANLMKNRLNVVGRQPNSGSMSRLSRSSFSKKSDKDDASSGAASPASRSSSTYNTPLKQGRSNTDNMESLIGKLK